MLLIFVRTKYMLLLGFCSECAHDVNASNVERSVMVKRCGARYLYPDSGMLESWETVVEHSSHSSNDRAASCAHAATCDCGAAAVFPTTH